MQQLLIEQKGPNGVLKTWRLRQEQEFFTFGTSKHADLRSPETSIKGIQGVFEWRNKSWVYVSLDLHTGNLTESVEVILDQPVDLRIGTTQLHIVPLEERSSLFESQVSFGNEQGRDTKPYNLFLVHHNGKLLETSLLQIGESFTSKFDLNKTQIQAQNTPQWVRLKISDLEISQRTLHLTSQQALSFVSKDQLMDRGSQGMLAAVGIGAILLALVFLVSPSSRDAREVALDAVAPAQKEIRMVLPKVKREKPKQQVAQQTSQAPKNASAAASAGAQPDRLSAIKSLSTSRISQLISKVSATGVRSKNVVVSQGVEAGTAPTGAALAALGNADRDGKDWKSESKNKGVAISTIGRSGGLGGIANLKSGATGSGGAELLEDESEVTGGLDREVIANYIKSQLGQILYCYERQLSADPNLYGKVTVKFTIGPTGGVETQRVGETTLKSGAVESCMLQKVARWKFPAPTGGTRVMVSYPFLFKSTN